MNSKKNTPSGITKTTHAEAIIRIGDVQEWMLNGYTRHKILQLGSEKWGVSERTIDEYIARAKERLLEITQSSVQENLAVALSALWKVHKEAMTERGPFKTISLGAALAALGQIAKLQGLEKHVVIIKDERELESLSDEDLNIMLRGGSDDRDPAEA